MSFLFYDFLKIFNHFGKSKKRNGCLSRLHSEIYVELKPLSTFTYESFYFVNALTSSSPKFVIIGNLWWF